MLGALDMRASLYPAAALANCPVVCSSRGRAAVRPVNGFTKNSRSCSTSEPSKLPAENLRSRRQALSDFLICSTALYLAQYQATREVLAEEEAKKGVDGAAEKQQSVFEGLKSLFDPDETTKLGKKLPKAYLKSARGVVTKLRDSFAGESKSETEFRRNADSAKEAIRDYVANWRGSKAVSSEESYQALEKALRVLGEFYSKKGPRALLPENVKTRVLESLQTADDNL